MFYFIICEFHNLRFGYLSHFAAYTRHCLIFNHIVRLDNCDILQVFQSTRINKCYMLIGVPTLLPGQPRRHLLTTGWSIFLSSKRLVAGDAFIFLRYKIYYRPCFFYYLSSMMDFVVMVDFLG